VGTESDVAAEPELEPDEVAAELEAVERVEAESPSEGEPPIAPSAEETGHELEEAEEVGRTEA